ncbi:hypothetical protein GBAR_LOCUS16594, partial [Geodia barretti]
MEETILFTKYRLIPLTIVMALVVAITIVACSPAEPQTIEVTRVVQVEVEKVVTEQVEVEKEVEVTRVVTEQVE